MAKEKRKFIRIDAGDDSVLWKMLETARGYHPELEGAEIGLGWVIVARADKDGRLVLGRMIRHPERVREQTGLDATIALNAEAWPELTDRQRVALLDHELCHLAQTLDEEGDQAVDGHGKLRWRTRKHDLEEFREVVERHGLWKADVERFAQACLERKRVPLFADVTPVPEPGDLPATPFPISDQAADAEADA